MSLSKEGWSPSLSGLKTFLNAVVDYLNNEKQYLCTIAQSNEEAPVLTVIKNGLSGSIVAARTSAGVYTLTLANEFTADKTFATIHSKNPLHSHKIVRTSANVLTITTYLMSVETGVLTATETDGLMNGVNVEIFVQA